MSVSQLKEKNGDGEYEGRLAKNLQGKERSDCLDLLMTYLGGS